jgi:FkbM family methyltransferase
MYKVLEKTSRYLLSLLSIEYKSTHKFLNKNQVSNFKIITNLLKKRGYDPSIIIDVGAAKGNWTKSMLNIYPNAQYYLFDADNSNVLSLKRLSKTNSNVSVKFALLSNKINLYKFFKMGYGSSIYEEKSDHKRKSEIIKSSLLSDELPDEIGNYNNNMMKIDVQGSELLVLEGLGHKLKHFEVIILEVSIQEYNKDAPLIDDIILYMRNNEFKVYDIYDLKRLGGDNSYLLQCDIVFIKKCSFLNDIKSHN